MLYKSLIFSIALIVAGCASQPSSPGVASPGGKADQSLPRYTTDLGIKMTQWGRLHSFDRMPAAATVAPDYPAEEKRSGVMGEVGLAVLVGEDGLVADVHVLKSSGNSHLDSSAVSAVKEWKYRPLEPRERYVTIQPIIFQLED